MVGVIVERRMIFWMNQSRPLEILLVEDHAGTAKLMRRLLMAKGHDMITAESVAAGAARDPGHDLPIGDRKAEDTQPLPCRDSPDLIFCSSRHAWSSYD